MHASYFSLRKRDKFPGLLSPRIAVPDAEQARGKNSSPRGMSPLTNRKEGKKSERRTRNALNAPPPPPPSPPSPLSRATPRAYNRIDTRSPGPSSCVARRRAATALPLLQAMGNGGQERWSPWQLHPARGCAERRRTVHRLHPLGWRAHDPDLRTADEDDGGERVSWGFASPRRKNVGKSVEN